MKSCFFVCALIMMAFFANAQYTPTPLQRGYTPAPEEDTAVKKGFDKDRVVVGGNLGASFGNYTFINVSPQVGYIFNRYVTAGVGVNFLYQSVKSYYGNLYAYKDNLGYAGMNVFGRFFPVRFLFISAQPELNYSWGKRKFNNDYSLESDYKLPGKMVPSFLLGAGAVLSPTGKGGMYVSLQYDVIQNSRSPYGTRPFLNIGFAF